MIPALEDALLVRLRQIFGTRVREVAAVAAQPDEDELSKLLKQPPAVYLAFLGGRPEPRQRGAIVASWGVYVVAKNPIEADRRRGDGREIGVYDMAALAWLGLDAWTAEAFGTLSGQRLVALTADAFARRGFAAFGLVFDLPLNLRDVAPASLDPFVTFHADWDVPPHGNAQAPLPAATPDAADTVSLPQE